MNNINKKWVPIAIVVGVVVIVFAVNKYMLPTSAPEMPAMSGETATKAALAGELQKIVAAGGGTSINTIDCARVMDTQFIALGEVVMGYIAGDEGHHMAMENMLGGENAAATGIAHSVLGKIYLRCPIGNVAMPPANALSLVHSAAGDYLADVKGIALYTFKKDMNGQSTCEGSCVGIWPPYRTLNNTSNLTAAYKNISVTRRTDGHYQFAWKGKPLYFYVTDKTIGDAFGDGKAGAWDIARP